MPLAQGAENALNETPMDYIDFRRAQVAAEAFSASTKKKGSPSPNRPKSGNKAEAFPLKKRREYIRAMENIADRLYFSNKLKREKERSLE